MAEKKDTARPKVEVLQDFIGIIYRHDPMAIGSPHEDEYDGEALSILSRFTESALHVSDDEEAAFDVAAGIVTECFNFWFDEVPGEPNLEPLTLELLTTYVNSYPEADAKPAPTG